MSGNLQAGFADLDTGRRERTGFPEVVFCQGKEDAFLRDIFVRLYGANGEVMGTRASPAQYEAVRSVLPGAGYDALSRLITARKEAAPEPQGNIAVCTAGTTGKTGVEMEALTGVNIALLTIYDMCKAIDKRMLIHEIHLVEKHGGKSGDFFYREEMK